jgi:hypothetical protein
MGHILRFFTHSPEKRQKTMFVRKRPEVRIKQDKMVRD